MNTNVKLLVTEIQRFCMHDGPGIRTTVFLKGCPLDCAWCHNPEAKKNKQQLLYYANKCIYCAACETACDFHVHAFSPSHKINYDLCAACGICTSKCPTRAVNLCGKEYTVDEICNVIEKDRAFYGSTGGVTLSGGEPFLQKESIALLKACKEKGLSTAVETCGYVDVARLLEAIPYTDLFLWDVKDTNEERHQKYVGASNRLILENLKAIDKAGGKTRLRCILVNGVNTEEQHYRSIVQLATSLQNCTGVDLIPYHAYAGSKAVCLGLPDNGNKDWIPTTAQLNLAKQILQEAGL